MKYIAFVTVLLTVCQPAFAHEADTARPAIGKTTAKQRAAAELVSARIRAALDGEAYTLDKPCRGEGCTASVSP